MYVSFSGGKDSTVLKHIVDGMYDDVPAVFVNTGLEYPEIQTFVKEVKAGKFGCFNPDVEIIRPRMRFDEVIKTYGYPVVSKEIAERIYYAKKGSNWAIQYLNGNNPDGTKCEYKQSARKWAYLVDAPFDVSHKCCDEIKKKPVKQYEKETGRRPILGTMACESGLRRLVWERTGCNAFEGERPKSAPLSFWTEQDILHYIKQYNVPYSAIYGEIRVKQGTEDTLETSGRFRTGCMFCMFGAHMEKEPNRFQRMKGTHPKQYEYCMNELGLKEVLQYIGVPYE